MADVVDRLAAAMNVAAGIRDRVTDGAGPGPRRVGTPPFMQSMGVAKDADSFFRLLRAAPSRPSGSPNGVAKDAGSYFQLMGVKPKQLPGGGTNG